MKNVSIMGFKADSTPHRLWQRLSVIKEDEDEIIFASSYPNIVESNGRSWSNSEPTLYIFPKTRFFNIIVMFRKDGNIAYYVNIATPLVKIGEFSYGYIDLDLDVKQGRDKSIKILDQDEFETAKRRYGYSDDLIDISLFTTKMIVEKMKRTEQYFDDSINRKMLNNFFNFKQKEKVGV